MVETRAPGFHLNTTADGASFTFGHFELFSVFPIACSFARDGNMVLQAGPRGLAFVTRAYGLHLGTNSGVTLGYHEYANLLEVDKSQSGGRFLALDLENTEKTSFLSFGDLPSHDCIVGDE